MRVGTRSWYSFNKFPMGLIFSENFSLTPANSFNKFLKRPEFSFFCFAQPLFLADISVTVTLRQKLKKADPNYFSIWVIATKNCTNIVKNAHFEFGEDPPRHKIEKNWGPKTSTFHVD